MTQIPENFAQGNGDMTTYSETSAFWMVNQVANFAYLRYDAMAGDVVREIDRLEGFYLTDVARADADAQALYKDSPDKARQYLTAYSVRQGGYTFRQWKDLSHYLLVKYMDGNIKKEKEGRFLRNQYNTTCEYPDQPGYPQWWLKKIAEDTGDKLKVPGSPASH
jgi:dipeptidase